jgi:hypothetical protein
MLNKILVGLLMACLTLVATADTVYKWVDSTGQIHYTDMPPKQADAKILSVTQGSSEFGDDEEQDQADNRDQNGDDAAANAASGASTPEPPVSQEAMAAAMEDAANAKTEQCKEAQVRYKNYIESRRLFREENGERVYLTDQELTEARGRAKQAVDDYCN